MKCLPREMIVESIVSAQSNWYPGGAGIDEKWRFVHLASPRPTNADGTTDTTSPRAHMTIPVLAKNLSKYPQVGETTSVEIFLR